ncbi:hypothetical protein OG455_29460 [Kitasatospora sp. NBC_01287]|uniref:hypothetical protein n=1 Tax=Kitasatospora sp. NBC_01287 TaxID=2903573 RepID=UPI002257EB07|nr:hypothetical protein [Kitasatospora sp. NBC_01287]MCX4749592.1 hypothetical protein [Kitasatospora sp. NBC_01287]
MGIGMLALYAALAVVALWLVAELLLQNRAPLHWRGVALGGFLLVAAGMAVHSVPVIAAGALAFTTGQVLVTLSVKRGYASGWSLRGADGSLPGPLRKVPLLSAATSGAAAVEPVAEPVVGEVGPIEEPEQQVLPEPVLEAVTAEGEYGVYESVYEQQPQAVPYGYVDQQQQHQQQQQQQQFDPNYGYQQQVPVEYGYYQQPQPQEYAGYEQQQWQQQAYDPSQYQPEYGIPQQHIPQQHIPQQHVPQQQSYEYYQQPQHEGWQ